MVINSSRSPERKRTFLRLIGSAEKSLEFWRNPLDFNRAFCHHIFTIIPLGLSRFQRSRVLRGAVSFLGGV